ncbi:MAG: MFS transporter [Parvularculaceae bacterium]
MSEENGARRNGQSKSEGVHSDVYVALVVLLLSVAMAFSLVDRFALSLLFEPIKADLGLSDTRLGLLHGVAFGIFYAAVGLPLGQLVDVWSRKWTIFWGLAIWSLATMACGFANDFSMLLLMRIGVGVGEAALRRPAIPSSRRCAAAAPRDSHQRVPDGLARRRRDGVPAWRRAFRLAERRRRECNSVP